MTITDPTAMLHMVADTIEAQPARYHQEGWATLLRDPDGDDGIGDDIPDTDIVRHPYDVYNQTGEYVCGTAHCIAGWAVVLKLKTDPSYAHDLPISERDSVWERNIYIRWGQAGAEILGLDARDADLLFGPSWQPRDDLTVPQALRLIAAGETVGSVTHPHITHPGERFQRGF